MEFSGSIAAITGAASGIGFALAQEAVRRGMAVAISDIRADALEEARAALAGMGGNVLAVRADVTKSAEIEALAAATVAHFGKANLLINNAGASPMGRIAETPDAVWEKSLQLKLKKVKMPMKKWLLLLTNCRIA